MTENVVTVEFARKSNAHEVHDGAPEAFAQKPKIFAEFHVCKLGGEQQHAPDAAKRIQDRNSPMEFSIVTISQCHNTVE